MRIYPHLFAKLFCRPVLLLEPVRQSFERALLARMDLSVADSSSNRGLPRQPNEGALEYWKMIDATKAAYRVEKLYQKYGDVAVITISGVIDKVISDFEMECYGGCDLADVDQALLLADLDPDVKTIVLYVNSPGGSASGVSETAGRVAQIAASKEVYAYVDVMACSAAYWIASQADQILAAPSAILGSIGVYMTILDATRAAEMEGLKVELITAGKYKALGSPFKPLSDEERAMLQERVTSLHGDFKAAVRAGRRHATEAGGHATVLDSTMEGQVFDGKQAVANRLADELVTETLDEVVTELLTETF
jgi:signal peptide peptidase SppA